MVPPEHIVWPDGVATTLGRGFTNTVAVIGVPGQPFAVGVIVKVTVIGAAVVLVNVPDILPLPLAAMPVTVAVLSLVHAYVVVPVVVLVAKAIVVIAIPEHLVCVAGVAIAFGVGFTITVAVIGVPGQPFADGVMVKVTVIAPNVVLVNIPLISPVPLAAMPITVPVLFLVHVYVVPAVLLVNIISVIVPPEHIVCAGGVATALGVGFTNTVADIAAPGQVLAVGVIVNVTVMGALVLLVSIPLMLPVPLVPIPPIPVIVGLVHA